MEATTAMIVSELRAGCTPWKRLWALKTSKKHWLQHKKGDFSIIYCAWRICRQVYENDKNAQDAQRLQGDRPDCWPGGTHRKGPPQVHEVLGAGNEHLQNICENSSVRGLEVESSCFAKGTKTGQFMSEASKTMVDSLKESFLEVWAKQIWPSSSPDCKPLDYFLCGVSEFRVCAADFSLLNLPKGKSLGRSKPATNS